MDESAILVSKYMAFDALESQDHQYSYAPSAEECQEAK
jgi:hypothetical protein